MSAERVSFVSGMVTGLTAVAAVLGGAATADPSDQDRDFLARLGQQDIPATQNESSLIAPAHRICGQLDDGMPFDAVVEDMRIRSFEARPIQRTFPQDRVTSTIVKFIRAAVDVYCPAHQDLLP